MPSNFDYPMKPFDCYLKKMGWGSILHCVNSCTKKEGKKEEGIFLRCCSVIWLKLTCFYFCLCRQVNSRISSEESTGLAKRERTVTTIQARRTMIMVCHFDSWGFRVGCWRPKSSHPGGMKNIIQYYVALSLWFLK